MVNTLQIYAQGFEHDDAQIVGTLDALKQLRRALDQAIEHGAVRAEFFASDGEGYWLFIETSTDELMDKMRLPYASLGE